MVEWSASSPSNPTILVQIALKSAVIFFVKILQIGQKLRKKGFGWNKIVTSH